MTSPIYTCLWYNGNAKQAAEFYCSVFKNSNIIADTPMVVTWNLDGRKFMGLNGGPNFKFNESVSFVVECKDQQEIDYYWNRLTEGGEESMCGWLKDKFGMSWQIIPHNIGQLMTNGEKGQRAMQALMKMRKLDIAALENA